MMPEFDFQGKKRSGFSLMKAPKSGVVGLLIMKLYSR